MLRSNVLALQAITPTQLRARLPELTDAEARKIVAAVHRGERLDERTYLAHVRRRSIDAVREVGHVPEFEIEGERSSQLDPFVKYVVRLADGQRVETVRIPLEKAGRFSVCVSSQVGCALGCTFCATGRMGLARNLETWEIVEQIRTVARAIPRGTRVHGVVFQGMGEPLANLDRVLETIAVCCEPSALAIDARKITVCTAGLPSGIRRLAVEAPRVRLGLSIGSADLATRRSLMPIDRAHPLSEVIDAAVEHAERTRLAPLWAVTLLSAMNDTPAHARALGSLASQFESRTGLRPRISVIPYNSMLADEDPFERSAPERQRAFCEALKAAGFTAHLRYSGGSDVGAACGQLVGQLGFAV